MTWDPATYLQFADQRLRPAIDLMARIDLSRPMLIYDLGCGAGNVTSLLRERWREAVITGVDSSAEMLKAAADSHHGIEWRQADIASFSPTDRAELIFSNAALHWLGDHETLFPRLLGLAARDGMLAVQMPDNFDQPSHVALAETAEDRRWRDKLAHLIRPAPVHGAEFYRSCLGPQASDVDVWRTTYYHEMEGEDPVYRWTSGTALRPFLAPLDETEKASFVEIYKARLREAYRPAADGRMLFPFRRLFIVARRA
ncbi:methyltransferase domain-containing protein [Oceanibacterium hippocampi]|uniref:Trans-aconitate 2-methyltransferase n=1 Tax=Oceanibacterium hippocampi TaxID=745714 RepID=A0A1Y5RUD7_9PROT|nr:methyltransferase domain-containing protein [Oceanibacterium hippocampi]SLN25404.1 Trans-aconitate 2-methyltransferase [Oceanibacterium hippocampi]